MNLIVNVLIALSALQAVYGAQLRAKTPGVTPFLHVLTGKMRTLETITSTAGWAYYSAYPACCPSSPNYDATADTTECTNTPSICDHPGTFSGIGHRDLNFVQSNNLISFYDNSDPNNENWYAKYGDKYATVTGVCNGTSHTFQALIADTCGNSDCDGCCSKNADPSTGYLITMEKNTLKNIFGNVDCSDGTSTVSFSVDTNQDQAISNCGGDIGSCLWPELCCGADNTCGYTVDECGTGCQPNFGYCASNNGTCGPISNHTCSSGCCGKDGYCGTGDVYCGDGCQQGYGDCDSGSSNSNGNARAFSFLPLHVGIFFVLMTLFLL
jgi:hypothetical protein